MITSKFIVCCLFLKCYLVNIRYLMLNLIEIYKCYSLIFLYRSRLCIALYYASPMIQNV